MSRTVAVSPPGRVAWRRRRAGPPRERPHADGVPYEYLVQKFKRRNGAISSFCLVRWYPYAGERNGTGHCGSGFPPTRQYGETWSRTSSRAHSAFSQRASRRRRTSRSRDSRAQVARVRVVHKDCERGSRDAPVHFVRVRGVLQNRVGSAEPFGFFVAFLPPSMERYYPRPGARADGPPAIEVIAYDDHGRMIGRFKHRNWVRVPAAQLRGSEFVPLQALECFKAVRGQSLRFVGFGRRHMKLVRRGTIGAGDSGR